MNCAATHSHPQTSQVTQTAHIDHHSTLEKQPAKTAHLVLKFCTDLVYRLCLYRYYNQSQSLCANCSTICDCG